MSESYSPFGVVLAEVLSEIDEAEEKAAALLDDPVERLSLAAHQTLLAQVGGQLPRPGAQAYRDGTAPQPAAPPSQLDVRF